MPFKSKAQQRYLESSASPLSEAQKQEWESATNFKDLPAVKRPAKGRASDTVVRKSR